MIVRGERKSYEGYTYISYSHYVGGELEIVIQGIPPNTENRSDGGLGFSFNGQGDVSLDDYYGYGSKKNRSLYLLSDFHKAGNSYSTWNAIGWGGTLAIEVASMHGFVRSLFTSALQRLGLMGAAKGVGSYVPLLTQGPGGKMLGEAMGVLKATPAAERAGMARELIAQVQARATGGTWKATEMAVSGGGRAWVGETHTMVIDAAGRVFSGPHVGGATQFGLVDGQIGVTAWSGLKALF